MPIKLVYYGNETLRKTADRVKTINQKTIDLVTGMYDIMHRANGIGLAAPQVGICQRIVVIDITAYRGPRLALINPEIIEQSEATEYYEEGCLSLPGISKNICRPKKIAVRALNQEQQEIEFEADGLLARVTQHEIDHLNGKLFIDYLEDYLRKELYGELKKIKKMNRAS